MARLTSGHQLHLKKSYFEVSVARSSFCSLIVCRHVAERRLHVRHSNFVGLDLPVPFNCNRNKTGFPIFAIKSDGSGHVWDLFVCVGLFLLAWQLGRWPNVFHNC